MSTKTIPDEIRQETKVISLDRLKPLNNYVVVEPISDNVNRTTKAGLIIVPPSYALQSEHVDRVGEVIIAPQTLSFNSLGWDCDMELRQGDWILYSYLEGINAPKIICDDKEYLLVPYSEIYAIKRRVFFREFSNPEKRYYVEEDEKIYEIIPINGYIICSQVKKKKTSEHDYFSEGQIDDRYVIAKFVGKPNRKYVGLGDIESNIEIKTGDKLVKDPAIAPKTESYYHAEFFGKQEEFIFLQRRFVLAILN